MSLSRRNFIKGSSLAITASYLPTAAFAVEDRIISTHVDENVHKILGCNIRVALPEDDAIGRGWAARKKACIKLIKAQNADLIGFQEVLKVQAEDLKYELPNYGCFGFEGPEMDLNPETYNGIAKNLVMYAKKRYEMISAGCYWLSETPEIGGSKSWNTARARHVNWLRLKDKKTGKQFRIMAVHLDHKDQEARNKQGQLIVKESSQYAEDFPQLLVGDFNVDATNPVYKIITDGNWKDTYRSIHGDLEPGATFHNFLGKEYSKSTEKKTGKIDFIFGKGNIKTSNAKIIDDMVDGIYPSDHYFVTAEISFT
jgi:endonuclease/exonuclease/phosphatase family metal-dependent hydrolase